MQSTPNLKGIGKTLIIGGISIAAITLGGFFMSQNPEFLSSMKRKSDLARHDKMMEQLLVAPKVCAGLDTSFVLDACQKLDGVFEEEGVFENMDWRQGLSTEQQTCLYESFNQVARYQLEYQGRSLKLLQNMQTDIDIVTHACSIGSDLEFDHSNHNSVDAESMINLWYQEKHEEGNDFQ